MKKTLQFGLGALLTAALLGGVAWAQQTMIANQGAPGNQGAWKVNCVAGCGGGSSGGGGVIDGGIVGIDGTYVAGVLTQSGSTVTGTGLVTVGGVNETDVAYPLPVNLDGDTYGAGSARNVTMGVVGQQNSLYLPLKLNVTTEGLRVNQTSCDYVTNGNSTITNADTFVSFVGPLNYITFCNSGENAAGTEIKCLTGLTSVSFGATNAGDFLQVGDCITYQLGEAAAIDFTCKANAASAGLVTTICGE